MKIILKTVLIFSLSIMGYAHADIQNDLKSNIFLSHCSHYGPGVSYSFQSCVNSNFSTIARATEGYFSHCSNFGKEVDYSFTSCVNSGFREAQRQLDNNISLQYCSNYDRVTLDYSFVSCVNSNFSQIQRELGKVE